MAELDGPAGGSDEVRDAQQHRPRAETAWLDAERGHWQRAIAFLLSMFLLMALARIDAPRALFTVALLGYVAVGAVWVRGQYTEAVCAPYEQPVPSWKLSGALVGIGIAAFVAYELGAGKGVPLGWVGLAGIGMAYAGVGFLITRARQDQKLLMKGRLIGISFAASIVMIWAGAFLLGWSSWVVGAVLLVVGLLLVFPVGLQLISEVLISHLVNLTQSAERGAGSRGWLRRHPWAVILISGLLLLAAELLLLILLRPNQSWLLIAVVATAAMVIAITSFTQADIVAVIAVVAILGVTPAPDSKPDAFHPAGGQRVLVVLGDSYMSGEGASVYFEHTDEPGGNQCRQAPTAWAALASQLPAVGGRLPFDKVEFLACSGARTYNVRSMNVAGQPKSTGQFSGGVSQLAAYHADARDLQGQRAFTPALVVVSLGGNDAGFGTIGQMCLAPGDCSDQRGMWEGNLKNVRTQLDDVYNEISATFRGTPVLVVPYPQPIARGACGQLALTDAERQFVADFVDMLDATIAVAAAQHGFYYLAAMKDALAAAHLQLCDPLNNGRPGINFIGLRSARGDSVQRFNPQNWTHNSLHPNEAGHRAMLGVFQSWYEDHWNGQEPPPAQSTDPKPSKPELDLVKKAAGSSVAGQQPPCDMISVGQSNCATQGRSWALGELGVALGTWGALLFGLAALFAWMIGIAVFAWRRSAHPRPAPRSP